MPPGASKCLNAPRGFPTSTARGKMKLISNHLERGIIVNIKQETQELRGIAEGDAERTKRFGIDLNPFSTLGARVIWQSGWDGVRPALMQDQSPNWRYWMRGVQARRVSDEQTQKGESS